MNGVMDYNWLGIAFIDDQLTPEVHEKIETKMDEQEEQVNAMFDQWLEENGLERAMGIIIPKNQKQLNVYYSQDLNFKKSRYF